MARSVRLGLFGLVALLLLLMAFWPNQGATTAPVSADASRAPMADDTVVGEIEGKPITLGAFVEALRHDPLYAFAGESGLARLKQNLADRRELKRRLDEYLTNEALYREAVRTGFPNESSAPAELTATMRSFTIEYFKLSLEAEVRKQVTLSKGDLAPFRTSYLVDQVGIPFDPRKQDEEQRAREAADEVRQILQASPADFGRAIDAYFKQLLDSSQIAYVAEKTSGWLTVPDLPEAIGAEIQNLKDGEIRVIRSDNKYTVVRLRERKQLSAREVESNQILQDRATTQQANALIQQEYQRLYDKHKPRITLRLDNLYDQSKYGDVFLESGDFYRITATEFLQMVEGMGVPGIGPMGTLYFVDPDNRTNAERFIQMYFVGPLIYYLEGKEKKLDEQPAFQAAYDYRRRTTIARLYLQRQREALRLNPGPAPQNQATDVTEERLASWLRDLRQTYGATVR